MKYQILVIIGILGILGGTASAHSRIRVVSTIPSFGAIAQEVGGPHIEVVNLVRPTQDPHFVDPKPSLMISLNRADLLLVTGMELEGGWLPSLIGGARNRKIQRGEIGYLDCSTLIVPKDVKGVDRAKGDIHPGGNPHYWTDPRNGLRLARGIATRLIELDSSHGSDIRERLTSFENRLKRKMVTWEKKLAPHRGTKVVVYHDSWVYFLDWVGFVQVGTLEPKPGIPPKPSHVAALIRRVQGQQVKYVLQESFYPKRLAALFAEKSGATLKILPTMVGASGTHSYGDVIEKLVQEVTR